MFSGAGPWLLAHPIFSEPAAPCVVCPRGSDDLCFRSHVDEVDPCALSRRSSQLHPACLPARGLKEVQGMGSEWAHLGNHGLNHDPLCADECLAVRSSICL